MTLSQEAISRLRSAADQVRQNAYSPYSGFRVGAALLCATGKIYTGCNVENASYGLTICAERNAVFHAVAAGERRFEGLLIYTSTSHPASPCGACRQVLAEFGSDLDVVSVCDGDQVMQWTLGQLLPEAFDPSQTDNRKT